VIWTADAAEEGSLGMFALVERIALFPPLLLTVACLAHSPPASPVSPPTNPKANPSATKVGLLSATSQKAPPKSPDVRTEMMGFVILNDGERLLRTLSGPNAQASDWKSLQAGFGQAFGLDPQLALTIDLSRPLSLALLNPGLLSSASVRPFIAMIPVRSTADVEKALKNIGAQYVVKPWGFELEVGRGRLYISIADRYAALAWRVDLLQAARDVLGPKMKAQAEAPLHLHVDIRNVYASYGSQIENVATQFAQLSDQGGQSGDPQLAFALRGALRLSRFLNSVEGLDLLCGLDSSGVTVTVRANGTQEGGFSNYVHGQRPGPAWGVKYLPSDSVLAFTTHSSRQSRVADVEPSLGYLVDAVPAKQPTTAEKEHWRNVLVAAANSVEGDLAYAVWPAKKGGVGVGGAYRIADSDDARRAVRDTYDALSIRAGGLVARALLFDPARFAHRILLHRSKTRIEGVPVDLVEARVHWPQDSDEERRIFRAMFGDRLVLGTAFIGDQALFAMGPDMRERLAAMIDTARGESANSLVDTEDFNRALTYKSEGRVSFTFLEISGMTKFAANLALKSVELAKEEKAAVEAFLSEVGGGSIVSTTNASGARFELTTHMPQSAMAGVARLHGALWRIALSPLVNPPTLPPLPIPPPHIAPSVRQSKKSPSK
jgi:hypothetical protein